MKRPALSQPVALGPEPGPPAALQPETQEKGEPIGYFCKESDCSKKHVFHRFPGDRLVWDIWPQRFECPVSGRRHEYWKEDLKCSAYA